MSLPILLVMVVLGVSAVGFAVHLSGGSQTATLADAAAARARYGDDFPDDMVAEVLLAANGEGAVLRLGDGAVGIVHNFGDHFVTRRLTKGTNADVRQTGPGNVIVSLHEFAWPEARFRFDDEDVFNKARAALGAVSGPLEETG